MASFILRSIRNVYISLHQDTNSAPTRFPPSTSDRDDILRAPASYPVCNIPGHHPDSAPHTHGVSASPTFARTVPHDHDDTALVPSFPSRRTDTIFASAHAPSGADESFPDAPLLNNDISLPVQTTPASCRIPFTSPDPVTTLVIHRSVDAPSRPMQLSTPEPSASPPSKSTSSNSLADSDDVAVEHIAVTYTASDDLNVRLSASLTPVLDDILPKGRSLPSDSAMNGSDHAFSSPDSHSTVLAPTSRDPSCLWQSSAPALGAAAEGEDAAKAALRANKENDVPDPSAEFPEGITVSADIPSQPPPPQSIVDVGKASLPQSSLDAEFREDHPPHPSHDNYDIV